MENDGKLKVACLRCVGYIDHGEGEGKQEGEFLVRLATPRLNVNRLSQNTACKKPKRTTESNRASSYRLGASLLNLFGHHLRFQGSKTPHFPRSMALIPAVATYCYHPGEVHAINGRDCHLGGPHLQRIFGDDGGIHNSHGPRCREGPSVSVLPV